MKILDFPMLCQAFDYSCGATALQSVLAYYGFDVREGSIMKIAGTGKGGTPIIGIISAARKYKLKCISKAMDIDEVKRFIDKKIPVIVFMQAWAEKKNINWDEEWNETHYAVIIGYDSKRFIFADPSSFTRAFLSFKEFSQRWRGTDTDKKRHANLGFAIYGRKPAYYSRKIVHMD